MLEAAKPVGCRAIRVKGAPERLGVTLMVGTSPTDGGLDPQLCPLAYNEKKIASARQIAKLLVVEKCRDIWFPPDAQVYINAACPTANSFDGCNRENPHRKARHVLRGERTPLYFLAKITV